MSVPTDCHDHDRRLAEKPVSKAITLCRQGMLCEDDFAEGSTGRACSTSMVRGWMPSACPAATLDGLDGERQLRVLSHRMARTVCL